ncbi:MAG: hypothetical protein IJ950_08885, partial [Helicobacter sp.]|nr:hypothetical protein [Helicobacter sp.]
MQFAQDDDHVLVPKTKEFIDRLGAELLEKTGFLLKVVVVEDSQHAISALDKNLDIPTDSLDSVAAREIYKQYLQKSAQHTPYAMIVMYIKDKKIDFVLSDRDVFDKKLEERVYFEYMVPLLPKGSHTKSLFLILLLHQFIFIVEAVIGTGGITGGGESFHFILI